MKVILQSLSFCDGLIPCLCSAVLSCSVTSSSLWCMDCSPPGSSVYGDSPGKILEWVAMLSSRGYPLLSFAWLFRLILNHGYLFYILWIINHYYYYYYLFIVPIVPSLAIGSSFRLASVPLFWALLYLPWGFPGGSDVKVSASSAGDLGSIPGSDPLEKKMITHSSILA